MIGLVEHKLSRRLVWKVVLELGVKEIEKEANEALQQKTKSRNLRRKHVKALP